MGKKGGRAYKIQEDNRLRLPITENVYDSIKLQMLL